MGEREGRATSGGRRSHQDHQQQAELGGAPPPAPTSAAAADVDLFCSGPPVTWHVARGSPALLEAAAILQVCN